MIKEIISSLDLQSTALSLAVITITTLIYYFIIYPLYFHPLAKVPGPKICALTEYYILYKSWNQERNRYINALHEKYGSIVRIGPNAVDISDITYQKDIYVGNYDKTGFYAQFVNYNEPNTFSTTTKKEHIQSRRTSHKFYSKSTICSTGVMNRVEKVTKDTLKVLELSSGETINAFIVFCDMAMDAVTSFSFGSDNYDSLLADPFGKGKEVVEDFSVQSSPMFWVTEMPEWFEWVASTEVYTASEKCLTFIERQFDKSLKFIGETEAKDEPTLLRVYFESGLKEPIAKLKGFNVMRTKSEFFDHIAAGHVTTSTTLSYLFYELGKYPEMQRKLQAEIDGIENGGEIIDYATLDDEEGLPYFHAVLNETFRVHAAIPGQEPRVVPEKGLLFQGNEICPMVKIPGGTTITMQPWSLHRVRSVFPDPEKFDPQRWIDASPEQLKVMRAHLMQFGAGTRMCIGMNLAMAEIKLAVGNIMARYNIELDDKFNYEYDGEMLDIYTTVPRSERMDLKFIPRDVST
ncbi:hypothetical protein CANINC_002496 [Pichia inconspicua]|uniref:Cytochrome P450 n=1 Tax=Pichia inconspicua TaxID=52247 RepID=A0A4T0X0T6_9ASCO|nr:hypothetical protein CANINC_002496 [[Candida] inconspicua]